MLRLLARLAGGACAALSLGPLSFAQCAQWDQRFSPPSPGLNGFVDGRVDATVVLDDGTGEALYVGGEFSTAGSVSAHHVAKWDGTTWSALGSGMDGPVASLAVFDDGSGPALFAGGYFTMAGGISARYIARWDGTSWSAVGVPGNGLNRWVYAMKVFDDGSGPALYAGGNFTSAGGLSAPNIARWDGTSWSTLGAPGTGLNGAVYALQTFDDGTGPALYAGGTMTNAGGIPALHIARWNGTSWSPLGAPGTGTNQAVWSLAVFDDGGGPALHVGGSFTTAGGVPAPYVAKWNGASWSALGGPGSGMGSWVLSLQVFDDGSGPALYAGGIFTSAGSVPASRIAKWNGASWSALGRPGSGMDGYVTSLVVYDDGSGPGLCAGGVFATAGGIPASRIAKWNGTSWAAVGTAGDGTNGSVSAFEIFDDGSGPALYAGGVFTIAGGVSAPNIARWSGTSWSALGAPGTGMNGWVDALAVFDDGTGPALYAAGRFTLAAGIPASRIARWDGTSWSALGPPGSGLDGEVHSLEVFDDGSGPALYAGGEFSLAGGVLAPHIARWDGTTWSALGSPGSGTSHSVGALEVFDDGQGPALYAAGAFGSAGGVSASYIARWDGTSWTALGMPGSGMNDTLYALEVFDDGGGPALYAGGNFTMAGDVPALRIAKWNGTSWSALGPPGSGMNGSVAALAAFDDGNGPALYAGGDFTLAGGVSAERIAKWQRTLWSPLGAPGSGVDGTVRALQAFDDGADGDLDLYLGGGFVLAGGASSSRVAQWHGCASVPFAFCFGDGGVAECPCGNTGLIGRGCGNSFGTGGALLYSSGTSTPDALVLTQQGELPSSLSIFLQGSAQLASPAHFGDGLRCTGGVLKRLYVKSASAGTVSAPQPADPSISAQSAALGDPLSPGTVRMYQVYYRDPDLSFCPSPLGDAFNVGNALRVVW